MYRILLYTTRLTELIRYNGYIFAFRKGLQIIKNRHELNYQARRPDNLSRWQFISKYICDECDSLVDVGCAEGEFCRKAESIGLDVTGYDYSPIRIANAKNLGETDKLRYQRLEINPETVSSLPEADVYLLLTVHHHWVREFGWELSKYMFNEICKKCHILFWEPPGHIELKAWRENNKINSGGIIKYYDSLLSDELGDEIQVLDRILVDYDVQSDRTDPMYSLKCNDF
jgi:hypothetical protein